jgi:LPS sulfotransferase NodH
VVTTGRTGSELLVDSLNRHPRMRCEGEILSRPAYDALRYVRGRARLARIRGVDAYGFKLVAQQARSLGDAADDPTLLETLARDGFTFARLRRKNLLRQALSHARAMDRGRWHARGVDSIQEPTNIDPVQLIFTMRGLETREQWLDRALAGVEAVELSYEDDIEDPTRRADTIGRIFAAVGLEPHVVRSDLLKQTPVDIRDAIANTEEVGDVLSRTRYAPYLADWLNERSP